MIATLTLNPAIDKTIQVAQLIPEKKLRCPDMLVEAGGGGINISKAISELGVRSTAMFTTGGFNGNLLVELLSHRNIILKPFEIKNTTRENIVVNEISTNRQYKFVMPGPSLNDKELSQIKKTVAGLVDASYFIISGSLPPGIPDSFLGELIEAASSNKIKTIIDTSGPALQTALQKGVYLVKPNLSELSFLVGKKYLELEEIEQAVKEVMKMGLCEVLVVSMGPAGAMLATQKNIKKFEAPVVKKTSTVGAGDSMIAGIVYMLNQNKSLEDAIRFGIACGTAASIHNGAELFKKEDAFRFYNWMQN